MIVSKVVNKHGYLANFQFYRAAKAVSSKISLQRSMTSSKLGVSSHHLSKEVEKTSEIKLAPYTHSRERWSDKLTLAEPKSPFTSHFDIRGGTEEQSKEKYMQFLEESCDERGHVSYSLALASTDDSFNDPVFLDLLDERMKSQLEVCSRHDVINVSSFKPDLNHNPSNIESDLIREDYNDLPINYSEATRRHDNRAIVVTEMKIPFRIVQVNDAWESLCGYSASECVGQTLSCIQGPDTDKGSLTALMAQLLKGEKAGTTVTNYKKDGSKFRNHLSVGPLKDQNGITTHFVGVLREKRIRCIREN